VAVSWNSNQVAKSANWFTLGIDVLLLTIFYALIFVETAMSISTPFAVYLVFICTVFIFAVYLCIGCVRGAIADREHQE
jgi:hypothetical protein